MTVLFFLPIQQLQKAYSYLLSLLILVLSHLWSTKIIAPDSSPFTLNFNYNWSEQIHQLIDNSGMLMASAVVQIILSQLFIALRISRPSYQIIKNNMFLTVFVELLLYTSFILPLIHAVLHHVVPCTVFPLTLGLSTFLPLILLVGDWAQASVIWVKNLPCVLRAELDLLSMLTILNYTSIQWARLRVPGVLRTMFVMRIVWLIGLYVYESVWNHYIKKASVDFSQSWFFNSDLFCYLLSASCETWVSLLGFSSMIALFTSALGYLVASLLGASHDDHHSIGIVSSVLFFILALQTGVTGLEESKRLSRLYRNFCLLFTAILHFFHNTVNTLLMNVSSSQSRVLSMHLRPLVMCGILLLLPFWMMVYLWQQHELSTWLLAVSAFCMEIIIKVSVTLTVYTLFMIDASKTAFWEQLDDYVYCVQSFGNTIEFMFGIFLFCNGVWIMLFESGGAIRATMMCVHAYFNIFCQAREGWRVFMLRRHAVDRIAALHVATTEQLERHGDVCAICYLPLKTARITVCKHFFHVVCLRKWLYVQDKCPICRTVICSEVKGVGEMADSRVLADDDDLIDAAQQQHSAENDLMADNMQLHSHTARSHHL